MDRYEEAFDIYDEVYSQIWSALASVQNGLSEFSFGYLTHNIRQAIEFKNHFWAPAVNTVFLKWFNLDIDQTLNEFIFSASGRLQSICLSGTLIEKMPSGNVITDYLILYNLILHAADDKWITSLFKVVTPVADINRLKKIRLNLAPVASDKLLIQSAEKLKFTDWNNLNLTLLDYLDKTTGKSDLYRSIFSASDSSQEKWEKHSASQKKKEKSEKHEKQAKGASSEHNRSSKARSDSSRFSFTDSSDEEKTRYFGTLLGLRGKVTKSEIRKRYLDEMAKYHPDKVASLGEELIDLAEKKTKEINAAYEWLRKKFNL
ncbi:MAG: DnaJ domain-containing protein [Ignavibacteria bacterium]|nr:DnaJ domain-containing protein [Ignavibacteria bacterium]MCU7502319.1 DnaJ domain-containing protein [Ignavibacteria bacterium]MCU7516637.1 DnaJ domain-containing protein [Ignavibacteria bacterium]